MERVGDQSGGPSKTAGTWRLAVLRLVISGLWTRPAQFWVQRALGDVVVGQICVASSSSNHNKDFMSSLCCSEELVLKSQFATELAFSTDVIVTQQLLTHTRMYFLALFLFTLWTHTVVWISEEINRERTCSVNSCVVARSLFASPMSRDTIGFSFWGVACLKKCFGIEFW